MKMVCLSELLPNRYGLTERIGSFYTWQDARIDLNPYCVFCFLLISAIFAAAFNTLDG